MAPANFISWIGHGAVSLAPPAMFSGVTAHIFAFKADKSAMQRLVDSLLNPASDGSVHYDALLDISMISFTDMERCISRTDTLGWLPGRECALWVPLLETGRQGSCPRVVFWTPYIFIDYDIGEITGREVWGWAKARASIAVPEASASTAAAFVCSTTVFDRFDSQQMGQKKSLLAVTSDIPLIRAQPIWRTGIEAAGELMSNILGDIASDLLNAFRLEPVLPAICMKQLRDSLNSDRACFQAIVESPARVDKFSGGGMLNASDFRFEIATCESHQIVGDLLGVTPTNASTILPITFAAWLAFDFEALPGRTLASKS